jgi:propanol-preferring alcohol dehydrogenase
VDLRHCRYCTSGRENLCDAARFTGYQIDGGYADYTLADARYCFPLAETAAQAAEQAPLLCAGLIGYRALRLAGGAERVGIYGFGAAAHIVAQVVRHQGHRFYAFTRPGDVDSQAFARQLGAAWAGEAGQAPPEALDAALIFAPAGPLVPAALKQLEKGGRLVCAGIHMSDIPGFPYADLWGERSIRSVANLTRQDGIEFLDLAPRIPVRTSVTVFPSKRPTPPWRSCGGARCRGLRCWRWTGPECRIALEACPGPAAGLSSCCAAGDARRRARQRCRRLAEWAMLWVDSRPGWTPSP